MKRHLSIIVCFALVAVLSGALAIAAITFNPDTGAGFVGKGDVQFTFGWNNAQLQNNAANVRFQAVSTVETEVIWICTNTNNQNTQERERTTTTTIAGLVESVARERNQITGFNLSGYDGPPTSSSSTTGPGLNTCPGGPWTLTTPAGDPVPVSQSTVLEVSGDGGTTWTLLLEKP